MPSIAPLAALAAASLAAATLPGALPAQAPVTLVGYVTDTLATPVPAAEVEVEGTPYRARTDERGAFTFAALRPGLVVVTVRRVGFLGRRDRVAAGAGDTLQLMLDLIPAPASLPGVVVRVRAPRPRPNWLAEFDARRARGPGSFITRADIDRQRPQRTTDVLRTLAGISIVTNGLESELRMARSSNCPPDVYVDGMEARGFRIDDIPPMDVGGIEIFRGPAEVPLRFRRRQTGGCGVVAIWTRAPGR